MRFEEYIKKNKLEKVLNSKDWRFDISMLITEARLHAGLTQKELAKRMKTKQPSIARVESGKMLPSLEFLDKLAKAIGTSLVAPSFAFMQVGSSKSILNSNADGLVFKKSYFNYNDIYAIGNLIIK